MMNDRQGYIRVVNRTDDPKGIKGKYDGVEYHFKQDIPLDVPEIVARHVFDFGKEDKSQALARLGWARSSEEMEQGMAMLSKIVFEDPPELIEAPRSSKKGRKTQETGAAGPPVTAGGTEGGVFATPPNGPKIGQAPATDLGDDLELA